MQCTYTTNSTL